MRIQSRRKRSRRPLILVLTLFLLCPPLVPVTSSRADDGKVKESIKSFGKKVGEKSAEAGHEIAGVAKKIWYKGKQVSAPLLHDVQRSTRRFWDETIRGKDKSIDSLRGENEKMKKDLDEGNE